MRGCTVLAASLGILVLALSSDAEARSNRPYWPAYEDRVIPEGCVVWNWQQLSYYDYCPRRNRGKVVRSRG